MSKSDDITKQEAEIIKSSIIYIESGDHLITDEAKRHKLALMVACAFVFMISLYPNEYIGSLFGIVKFRDESGISLLKILPFAIIVMFYQGAMYAYHLNEAKDAKQNKDFKSTRKENIHLFNNIIDLTNDFSEKINHSIHYDYNFKTEGNRFNSIRESINNIQNVMQKIPNLHPQLTALTLLSKSALEKAEKQEEIPLQVIKDIYNNAKDLNLRAEHLKRISGLNAQLLNLTFEINSKCEDLDIHFVNQYNYYLTKLFNISLEHNNLKRELNQDKVNIIKALSRTAYNKKAAFYIYTVIPAVFFLICLVFSLFTYITGFLEKCPYVN